MGDNGVGEEVKSPSKRVSIAGKGGIKFPTDEPSEDSDEDDDNEEGEGESDETDEPTSRNGSARRPEDGDT